MPDTASVTLKFVGDEANSVTSFDQALGKLVAVGLNTSELREGKVCDDQYTVLLLWFFIETRPTGGESEFGSTRLSAETLTNFDRWSK